MRGRRGPQNGEGMAFDAYDDYEQGELVQKWLRQNGLSIVVGIAIGLVGIFGWQQWRNHQASRQMAAANLYQQLQAAVLAGQNDQADRLTGQLQSEFADSSYTAFAVGERAQREVQAKQLDKALASLQWAEGHLKDAALKALMQLRIAQVELASGKAADALARIDGVAGDAYKGLAQELRGDALVKLNRPDDARKAYEAALAALGEDAPQRGALQMKLDDLAVAGKQGA